jgi:hypothetical protein
VWTPSAPRALGIVGARSRAAPAALEERIAMLQPLRRPAVRAVLLALVAGAAPAYAEPDPEIEALKRQMQELLRQNAEQQQRIQKLEQQLEHMQAAPPPAAPTAERAAAPAATPTIAAAAAPPREDPEEALERALEEVKPPTDLTQPAGMRAATRPPALLSRRVGPVELRLVDVSFDILAAAGSSTVGGQDLRDLQGGAHDPNRRGFTLQQGELSLAGAVDPYFVAEAHAIFTDSSIELEEAYFVTTSLPWDLQVKGGYFLTAFGRINPVHAHAWTWLDQPVVITRLLGGEGLRSPGIEASWLAPLSWFSLLTVSMQDGDEGDLTVSFLDGEGAVGGRPAVVTEVSSLSDFVYLARWANAWEITPEISALVGVSGLYGANSTGPDASTFIYGTDLTFKWRPAANFRGWPFVVWQSELLKRDYTAAAFVAGTESGGDDDGHGHGEEPADEDPFPNDLPGGILRDYGFYTQLTYGFAHPWAAGIRLEYATGVGKSVEDGVLVSRQQDPLRGDRLRVSPLLLYHVTEFSRLRLQFNYDNAKFLPGNENAYTVWVGGEVLFGSHPAHQY